jgi:hypothetical protein
MSVSYVVPVWREEVYQKTAKPWIEAQVAQFGAELIEVRGKSSIFDAMEYGRQNARHDHIMYVHDDVRLLSPVDFSERIVEAFARFPKLGILGPVGKIAKDIVPWWMNPGRYVGHWHRRGRHGQIVYQFADDKGRAPYRDVAGGDPVADWKRRRPRWDRFCAAGLVDGFYLIEHRKRMATPWDTTTYGKQWHGYDVDRCFEAHRLGLDVMVSPWLFLHDNAGHAGYKLSSPAIRNGTDRQGRETHSRGDAMWLADLDVVNRLVRRKWGLV